jgi:hypothetical protein
MEDCEENIGTCKRKRALKNKNKQGDKGYIIRGRYSKIYKIPVTKMVWSC